MTFSTVSVSLDGTDEQLRQLAGWLRNENDLRGRVTLVQRQVVPGQMGGMLDAVEVMVTSGTAGSLVTSLFAWLGHRRATGRVKLTVRNGNRTVELTCGSADDATAILHRVKQIMADGD